MGGSTVLPLVKKLSYVELSTTMGSHTATFYDVTERKAPQDVCLSVTAMLPLLAHTSTSSTCCWRSVCTQLFIVLILFAYYFL